MRRFGTRGAGRGRGGGAVSRGVIGHTLVTSSNRYATAAGAGIRGAGAGFYVASLVSFTTTGSANYVISASSSGGWRQWVVTTTTNLRFSAHDGTVTLRDSPPYDITSVVGKILAVCGVWDGSFVRLYVNGAEVGSGTAMTGYTAPAGAASMIAGQGGAAQDTVWFGTCGGDGVPSAANILAWAQGCKAASRLVTMPGVAPQHMWIPLATPANIADSVGSDTLTKVGSPVAVRSSNWGF